jgi:DNA-binding NarL/FixJ family response regulator
MSIKIVLADDHRILREGFRAILQRHEGIEVIGEAGDGLASVELARKLSPDIVIMDVSMPKMNGIEATRAIVSGNGDIKVIGLSMHASRQFAIAMLKAGASGYLLKSHTLEELLSTVRAVLKGEIYLCPHLAASVLEGYIKGSSMSPALSVLTDTERKVLQLISEGLPAKEIAEIGKVSILTIETHQQQIMSEPNIHAVRRKTFFLTPDNPVVCGGKNV